MAKMNKTKKTALIASAILLPAVCAGSVLLSSVTNAKNDNAVKFYTSFKDVKNSTFNKLSSTYASNNIDGWKLVRSGTKATTMVIDVDKNFSTYNARPYCISTIEGGNPGKKGADNKVLMINSANTSNNPSSSSYVPSSEHEGYKSDELTLDANSYYSFEVSFKTVKFSSVKANPFASVYLSGLTDNEGNEINLSYEMISANDWETVYFFVETGSEEQKVNLELWLGTEELSSFGVAFFDEVYVQQYSQNIFYENYYTYYYDEDNAYFANNDAMTDSNGKAYNYKNENPTYNDGLDRPMVSLCELNDQKKVATDLNLDFEANGDKSSPANWSQKEGKTQNASALVFDLNLNSFNNVVNKNGNDYPYTGANLDYNNKKALAMWTTGSEEGYVALTSKDISIKAHEVLKISALVKVSELAKGEFFLHINETDEIFTNFPALKDHYETLSTSAKVSANGSNLYNNEYAEVSIYLQGHDMYDSTFNITLALGSEDANAKGCVVVDNVTVERAKHETFSNASSKLKLTTTSQDASSLTVPNGFFNDAHSEGKDFAYPLVASNWTKEEDSNNAGLTSGVINTYKEYFKYLTANEDFKNLSNPAKNSAVSNNMYMFSNRRTSYQSIKSGEFKLTKNSYYYLTFDYQTIKTLSNVNADITLDIYTTDDLLIYSIKMNSSSNWDNHKAYLFAGENDISVYAKISFGTKNAPCQGFAYIDNVKLEESAADAFASATNKSDLSNFMLNLDPNNTIKENISPSLAYSGASDVENCGQGGIAKGKGNTAHEKIDDGSLTNNVLAIMTAKPGTYTLTSKFKINLEATSYYKLSFRLLTSLPDKVEDDEDEEANKFGVSVGLKDMTLAENLVFNDKWTECTFYFHNEDASALETNLVFSLTSNKIENTGYAFLTDLVWTEAADAEDTSIQDAFTAAENEEDFGKTIFTSTHAAKDESEEEDKDDTTTENNGEQSNPLSVLLYVSTAITALAVIIAIVGVIMRKIKIKKINKTKTENYDRKVTVDANVITHEARRIRNEEAKAIEESIATYAAEMKELEDKQKANIAESRKQNGKITKDIEKEFKSYASKRGKIQDKLNILNEKLANVNSPEYMISLEKKVASQMLKAKKEAYKQADLEKKAKEKAAKAEETAKEKKQDEQK